MAIKPRISAVPPYEAQLALLVEAPPAGDEWLHEQKFDGYRIGLRIDGASIQLWSRRGQEWTADFPSVVAAGARLGVRQALIDGEIAVLLPSGVTSFQALQNRPASTRFTYFAFDLLHLDGEDLRDRPLIERKKRLRQLVGRKKTGVIRYSDHVVGGGRDFFATACRLGLEGIVSKRGDARYRAGRNGDWQKTKCLQRQEFVIGGFTDPEGSRDAIGSLLIGHYDAGRLAWAGKVGTGPGWTGTYLRGLRRRLEGIEVPQSPFDPPVGDSWLRRNAHWVRPELVAEVAFAEWTNDGRVRHPSMQGIREDKDAKTVMRERPAAEAAPSGSADTDVVAGIRISHPERVIYPDLAATKLDIARYYQAVGDWMLPHVAGRPLTLLRCAGCIDPSAEKGGCVMMRHGKAWGPSALRRVRIKELRKTGEYLVADTREAIVALAQMGVVEIHTWNSRSDEPYLHDRIVLDLDPGPAVGWRDVVAAAKLIRDTLAGVGLQTWVKTTGGRGLHVVLPIEPAAASASLAFARTAARALVEHDANLFTTAVPKRGRENKILLDVLRNNRTNTSVAAYSLRARAGATVSMPLGWEDLDAYFDPSRFNLRTVPERLQAGGDPWKIYWSTRQRLPTVLCFCMASRPLPRGGGRV
jgi:bifunctional non-homologous end joining protein LigD